MKIIKNSFFLVLVLLIASNFVFAQKKAKTKSAPKSDTPCMDVLNLFIAANVPAMAPEEELAPLIPSTEETPPNLPGKGLAQHPMLYVGENCNRMFLVNEGKIIWTYNTGKGPEFDDVWMLPYGSLIAKQICRSNTSLHQHRKVVPGWLMVIPFSLRGVKQVRGCN